jgi:hypothetical protein
MDGITIFYTINIAILIIGVILVFMNNDGLNILGVMMIILDLVIGWLIVGISANYKTEDIDLNIAKIEKTENLVIIEFENNEHKFIYDKKVDYDNICDTVKFYLENKYNFYNYNISSEPFYYINKNKHKPSKSI